jgi:NADPH-dependent F420 reductase
MRVAVVGGTGTLGSALAWRLAEAGHPVVVGSRVLERAVNVACAVSALAGSGAPVEAAANRDAARAAEVVVVAVPPAGHAEAIRDIAPWTAGRVVVDACVFHHPERPGAWAPPPEGSAALAARRLLPAAARLAATFHTITARSLTAPRRFPPGDVPVVADSPEALEATAALLQDLGLPWVAAGGLEASPALEHLAVLLAGLAEHHGVPRPRVGFHGLPRRGPR